jgi:hypothetical protein
MHIASTMYFRPAMRTTRLLMPDFDETEFFLQLRIGHDFIPQRSGSGRNYLNDGLHSTAKVQQEIVPFAMSVYWLGAIAGRAGHAYLSISERYIT